MLEPIATVVFFFVIPYDNPKRKIQRVEVCHNFPNRFNTGGIHIVLSLTIVVIAPIDPIGPIGEVLRCHTNKKACHAWSASKPSHLPPRKSNKPGVCWLEAASIAISRILLSLQHSH